MTSSVDPVFLSFQLAIAGRYSIDRELGRGGMGIVYLAREVHLDRMVAIKLLPPDRATDPRVRDGFLREARNAAKLSHPNIIPIYAVEETAGFVFYVMAFINGETLGQKVQARGPLPASEVTRVLREVAWALSHAHSHGLVHRDVKPDNILLESGTGRVLVADFGIASAAGDVVNAGGSPEFMSPEQALGGDVDARSDLYALGVTAFYTLSGRLPFEGGTPVELLARHVTEPPPPLASTGIAVPRRLAALVDRCLEKQPELRPTTADALAEQLGVALEQRRDIPIELRAFVKRSSRVNSGGVLPLFVLYGIETLIVANSSIGIATGLTMLVTGTAAVSFGYLVWAARRMLRLGFVHADIGPAFASEIERAQEEGAVEHGREPTSLELGLKAGFRTALTMGLAALTSLGVMVLGGWQWQWWGNPLFNPIAAALWDTALTAGALTIPTGVGYLGALERRRDIDMEFWSRVWAGRIGQTVFSLARRLLGRTVPVNAVTHRATEFALSMAAESLFEQLPPLLRTELGDVPGILRRLENDAQQLRRLYDELEDTLRDIGDAAFSDAHASLRADRDRIGAKLGETVTALETIRLNLLRMHAGSATVQNLTVDLDLAADVAAEVDNLLRARREVETSLQYPRIIAATPA